MLVNNSKGSFFRFSQTVSVNRNGSFIDLWVEIDGERLFLGINESQLREYLEGGQEKGQISVTIDQSADAETLMKRWIKNWDGQKWMK